LSQETENPPSAPSSPSPPSAPSVPQIELFGGYTFVSADPFAIGQRSNLNGWEGAFAYNPAKWLSLVADFSGAYGSANISVLLPSPFPSCPPFCPSSTTTFSPSTRIYTYLFGVNVPYRKRQKITPFAQALFGRAHAGGTVGTLPQQFTETDTKLAVALGVGVDYQIRPRLAWRLQADYLQTRVFSNTEDNYRISTGIVFRYTRKKKVRTLTTP